MSENSNPSLFSIVAESQQLMAGLMENGGEITPEIETKIETLGNQLVSKVDNYVDFMDRLKLETEFFKKRKDQFASAQRSVKALEDRLKHAVLESMDKLKTSEVKGESFRIVAVNGADAYDIDEKLVPEGYFIEVVEKKLDKTRLLEDVKMGLAVDGVSVRKVKSLRKYTASTTSAKKKTTKKASKKTTKKTTKASKAGSKSDKTEE